MKVRRSCPSCNQSFKFSDLRTISNNEPTATLAPDEFVQQFQKRSFPEEHLLPEVKGSLGSKIMTILKHIKYLALQEPTKFKCLVFSQWEDVLRLIETGCQMNDIGTVRFGSEPKRKRDPTTFAPMRFKEDPTIQVFLLNARSQSAGLTLVAATHIFFVEPCSNPAIELQAMGRVHRLGQRSVTHVHRYIVRGTIEEEVFKLGIQRRGGIQSTDDDEDTGLGPRAKLTNQGEVVDDLDLETMLYNEMLRGNPDFQVQQEVDETFAELPVASVIPVTGIQGSSSRKKKTPTKWNRQDLMD